MGQSALRDRRTPFRSRDNAERGDAAAVAVAVVVAVVVPVYRKGIGLIFPNPDTERGLAFAGPSAATQTNSETLAGVPGRVVFSL